MEITHFRAMGSQIGIWLDCSPAIATSLFAQAQTWFENWNARFSRFSPTSELSLLNAQGHAAVSDEFWQVLEIADQAVRESDGLFNPLVLNAVRAVGYQSSWSPHLTPTDSTPSQPVSPLLAWELGIRRDPRTQEVWLAEGQQLDLGGIVKSWAADTACQRLSLLAPCMVNAGGDVATGRVLQNGSWWPVGLVNPFQPEKDLLMVAVSQQGVATSGRDLRQWQLNGVTKHHIIDPRTGDSAITDILSVSVVADTTRQAETAARTVLILGSQAGMAWLNRNPHLAALVVLANQTILMSGNFRTHLLQTLTQETVL
jgi:thiamine biosynthesis lipoprotein